ncbi:MAG: UrcA family protein [Sphingomonas sp.]|uniref:UrcA family protein n=1 Tax=Sphingomonas sp. TaxID=28214 RepID=UPI001B2014A6|nr:UrcA family protein [Sphingomonas sp.]MBO9623556.1 UrcA family protein [Sphingomonas sp.]
MSKPLIALAFLAAAAATPSVAAPQTSAAARVSYADLDLARPADRKILDRRVTRAAEKLCPPLVPTGQLTRSVEAVRCLAAAKASAQLQRSRAIASATTSNLAADSR